MSDPYIFNIKMLQSQLSTANREITRLRTRVVELEEVVRFYADIHTWKSASVFMCGHDGNSRATVDRGEKARAALKDTTHEQPA